jgi:hypothetical protein
MISSRPTTVVGDVRDLIAGSGASIQIIDDAVSNPSMFSIVLSAGNGKQIPLLIQRADQKISLADLINMLQSLEFDVNYIEVR